MIGRSLAHYRILQKLGAGGMGEVYLAEDERLGRRVALKILSARVAGSPRSLERFRFEARALAAINHPNIVTVHSVEEDQGRQFFTMEYVDGGNLAERFASGGGIGELTGWAIPLADALAAAHAAGIVHRDLKPGNVMINARGQVKVLDFGLAKRVADAAGPRDNAVTQDGALVGTVAYMAPEQIRGAEVDGRTDLFAAGVLMYEMAAGRHPFDGEDTGEVITAILNDNPPAPSTIRPELGGGLDAIVGRCLEKDPDRRYQAAAELQRDLEGLGRESAGAIPDLPLAESRGGDRRAPDRPRVWSLPHLRNRKFTARDAELDELRGLLDASTGEVPLAAVVGLGGVGKTQLVVEYAHRFAGDYRVVWWLPAEEPAGLLSRYASLARELGLPMDQEVERTVARVRDWLGANPGWLLVFDNVEEPASVRPYLPPEGSGQVLVTSRNPAWRGLGRVLELDVWAPGAAAGFLERRTGDSDAAAAAELHRALGGLPLALEQAAAYIEASGQSLASYSRLYREQELRLLAREGAAADGSAASVVTTWDISFRQVARFSPAAEQLLDLCAFLAPDDIPLDLLQPAEDLLPEPLAGVARDVLALDEALTALLRFSLVSRAEGSLSVHRLVQAVVRRSLGDEARTWAERALDLLSRAFPAASFREVAAWPRCSRLLPHALACLGRLGEDPPAVAAELLDSVGTYLNGRGQYQEARAHLERALAIEQAVHGPDHPRVASRLNSLGRVVGELGRAEEALALFDRALEIDEAVLGPDDPKVAKRLNNIGKELLDLGRWQEAERFLERALEIDEAAFGPAHPAVSMRVVNIGVVHAKRGDFEAARDCFERALEIDEAAFGPNHPRVALDLGNCGAAYKDLGDLETARRRQQRALDILERSYGPDHPTLARPLRNLGEVLHLLGHRRSARAHLDRALEIERAAWGGSHPDHAATLEQLGLLARDQGRAREAQDLLSSSLRMLEEHLGPNHPDAVRVRERLRELGA